MTKPSQRYEAALAAFRRSGGSVTKERTGAGYTLVLTVGTVSVRTPVSDPGVEESAFLSAAKELYERLPTSA